MKLRLVLILVCLTATGILAADKLSNHKGPKLTGEFTGARKGPSIQQRRDKKPDPPGTIDGAKNPALIPDKVAYSILFRFVGNHNSDEGRTRIRAYLKQAGLTGSDIDSVIATADEFEQHAKVLDAEAKRIKDGEWPHPRPEAMTQLSMLQQNKETRVTATVAALQMRLTTEGLNILRRHVSTHMKPRIKLHPGPAEAPGGTGWKPHATGHH